MELPKSIHRKELIVIYRQEILKDIRLFTSQPAAKFYDSLFLNLDLSSVPEFPKTGRRGFSNHAMLCSFIVMKCEVFSMLTDLVDYLNNNLLIAHYCGFDITSPFPSYWTFDRFLKYFKSRYSLRTECERYNSRFKNTGQERMWVRNISSVTNLNSLAHISLLAVATTAIPSHSNQFYRRRKTVKRIA